MKHLKKTLIGFALAMLAANPISATTDENQMDVELYSSYLENPFGTRSMTIRGFPNGIDDIAGFFRDSDGNSITDGIRLEALQQGNIIGNMELSFNISNMNGVRLLSFPVTSSDNFPVPSDLLDTFPDNTSGPMVPITDDNRFELTTADGIPILSFDLMIEAEGDDGGGDDGGGEPDPFVINLGLVGAWFNALIPGQGYMIDILADQNFIFIAWFTYTPEGELTWFTARGVYNGNRVELDLIQASNGLFNEPTDVVQTVEGSVTVEFTDCLNGSIEFDIPDFGLTGIIPITRIAGDQICQSLVDGDLVIP